METMQRKAWIANMTYEQAENWYRQGCISQDEWEAYCDAWRNSCFRYSSLAASYRRS